MTLLSDGLCTRAVAVTKANSDIPVTRRLYIGGAGDVVVYMNDESTDDTVVTFSGVPAGTVLPIAVRQVRTATTATLIIAMY